MHSGTLGPIMICMALAVAAAASPLLRRADAPVDTTRHRTLSLDGLRGFLALAVLLSHGTIYQTYLQTGAWVPVGGFDGMLGQGGVSMFFMLTGFLFWSRLVRARGRLDWLAFFIGRVFRIGPVYLLAAGVTLLATVALTRQLNVTPPVLVQQVAHWLPLGALTVRTVNGYDSSLLLAGVTWSLQYEWIFYASLPVLAALTLMRWTHLPGAFLLLAGSLAALLVDPAPLKGSIPAYAALFAVGMVTASLNAMGAVQGRHGGWSSALAVLLLGGTLALATPYSPGAILGFGGAFYLIATGCSLFGALHSRAARRLGNISYNIYLLQGLLLAALLRPAPLRALALGSPVWHWSLVGAAMLLLLPIATASHVLVEMPGVRLGATMVDALSAWKHRRRDAIDTGLDALERERPA